MIRAALMAGRLVTTSQHGCQEPNLSQFGQSWRWAAPRTGLRNPIHCYGRWQHASQWQKIVKNLWPQQLPRCSVQLWDPVWAHRPLQAMASNFATLSQQTWVTQAPHPHECASPQFLLVWQARQNPTLPAHCLFVTGWEQQREAVSFQ